MEPVKGEGMLLVTVVVFAATGCSGSGGEGDSSCPLALEYDGRTYYAMKTEKPVTGSETLADVGFSLCDDSGGQDERDVADAAARFTAQTVEGIDPSVAFVVPSEWPRYLFYSGPTNASTFPPGVKRLLNH
jgi:hypothetical protein